jgi:predicted NAD/FAD-binding protein
VDGGSREYVTRMLPKKTRLGCGAVSVRRTGGSVEIRDSSGEVHGFDHVVMACHADQALRLLDDPTDQEATLLGAFGYSTNRAVLHTDPRFMPKRRAVWAGWNYVGGRAQAGQPHVTYWMNRLQGLTTAEPLFVTINPAAAPASGSILHEDIYEHPRFNAEAMRAQSALWSLQGVRRTWFCGAYFGSGFHEDGLQAGLAVAEQLGGVRRPWTVANESGRIHVVPALAAA